jgi:hypothetical protein
MPGIRPVLCTILLVGFGLLGAACQPGAAAPATPPPAAGPTSALAAAQGPIPTAAAGKGVVHGVLLHTNTQKPITEDEGIQLFLAPIMRSSNDAVTVAGLDKTTAPRALPDSNGTFVFTDVAPGEYALVLVTPLTESLIRDPADANRDLIVKIAPDQTTDLGSLYIQYPPEP